MKICMVTTSFPRWEGDGQGAFIWQLARAIASCGIQVRVVAMHSPGALTHEYFGEVEIFRPIYWWPEKWEMLRKAGGGLPVTWRRYPWARLQILPFFLIHTLIVTRYARSCDLIHAHWTLSAAAAYLGQPVHRRRILATVQGSDIFQVTRNPVGAWITRETLHRCDLIVALSRALQERVIRLGVDSSKIYVIPNGVDTIQFTPLDKKSREPLILFVGSLIPRKGVNYLLQAMPYVFLSLPEHRLVIVGEGPEKPFLHQLTKDLGIEDRVSFVGDQPHQEVKKWMQRARVLVLPSLEEGMGVVLVEALACGTPVVASCIDGIRDVVTPDVGVLVPPADPKAMSEGIVEILRDPGRWAEASQNARARAEMHYRWDKVAKRYVELYQILANCETKYKL